MATVEELVQMMNTLQGQQHALKQEILRLTAENQQFRNAGSPGLAEIATVVEQAVQTAMANTNQRTKERLSLVDNKGLGKTKVFKEESARFTKWLKRTMVILIAAYGSAVWPVIEWAEDQDNVITNDALEQQLDSLML